MTYAIKFALGFAIGTGVASLFVAAVYAVWHFGFRERSIPDGRYQ